MTETGLTLVPLADGGAGRPLLVLGPSLGTAVETLWAECAAALRNRFEIAGWELPGHGRGAPAAGGFTMAGLAKQVIAAVDARYGPREFAYAGDSVGGAVGLALLLDHAPRVTSATLVCTGARIGTGPMWRERAELVRARGTAAVLDASLARWLAPGFAERQPAVARALAADLGRVDPESYALTCEALARFDVRDRLSAIAAPVSVIAGAHDVATPVADGRLIADSVTAARLIVLDSVAHLAPAEAPGRVAEIIAATAHARAGARRG